MTAAVDLIGIVEDAIEIPRDQWGARCHEISLAIVRTMYAPGDARVARGWCDGVGGQHSWVVTGYDVTGNDLVGGGHWKPDCYDQSAPIIDPTLWWYLNDAPQIWTGTLADGRHRPHGQGSIWQWGRPDYPTGPHVTLTPRTPWSGEAQRFLALLGPLDRTGWVRLAHAPVEGWPAGEIIDAICESGMEAVVPIDIVGMVTDRNPDGLYLREADE